MSNIKKKSGKCHECGYVGIFAHNAKKLCYYCNEKRKNEEKKAKGKKPYRYVKKATGERELFLEIWNSRPHVCEWCGRNLDLPRAHYFAHVISKGSNESKRLEPENIGLLCYDFSNASNGCHHLYDHGTREQFQKRKDKYRSKHTKSRFDLE